MPLESPSHGLAFDSKANDYKLVRALRFKKPSYLKSNPWRSVLMTDHSTSVMKQVGILVDAWSSAVTKNALHWIGLRSRDNRKVIIAFDLVNEEFREIQIPDQPNSGGLFCTKHRHCCVFQDCLPMTTRDRFGFLIERLRCG
ncbi:LOW QUALITY PROTEIN: hypothetical protein TorRG33x02_192580 [Trema orientale]|uniref:Uncharacterized protein n=1 Tax=Trema orientale TaxID=63057 RepID=A0A2P5EHI6_TREOI|nr:LOW QUALITY PROTEIN: hypothetical protein TorRG33x02_192580 [Trema orientale]